MASITISGPSHGGESPSLPARRRLTADEFYRMAEAGILGEDDRVELIEGELIQMAAMGIRHMHCVNRITEWFVLHVAGRAIVSIQNAVLLPPFSMPQPDLALFRLGVYDLPTVPGPEDVLLVIEVSDTTLRYDRGTKLPLYARAGIAEVWIVDLVRNRVLVNRQPRDNRYELTSIVTRNGSITPSAFPDLSLPVAQILGRA